jgi:hypothetical protein
MLLEERLWSSSSFSSYFLFLLLLLLLLLSSSSILKSSQSQSHVTTDGQSASLSWKKAPIWGLRPDFYYYQTVSLIENTVFSCRVLCYLATFCSMVHREHISYSCVFAGTCILSRCLAIGRYVTIYICEAVRVLN